MSRLAPFAVLIAVSLLSADVAAEQTQKFPCAAFRLEPNRTLSVLKPMSIKTVNGVAQLEAGTSLTPGENLVGIDLYAAYQQFCR